MNSAGKQEKFYDEKDKETKWKSVDSKHKAFNHFQAKRVRKPRDSLAKSFPSLRNPTFKCLAFSEVQGFQGKRLEESPLRASTNFLLLKKEFVLFLFIVFKFYLW